MDAIITIHPPMLTEAEREYRMEQLKKATITFHKAVMNNRSNKYTNEKTVEET